MITKIKSILYFLIIKKTEREVIDVKPTISVIIRTLNERERLAELLSVIRSQDYFHQIVDVIVVDNESADGTPKLALQNGAKLITIKRDDFSYPVSLNKGAEVASGEILVYLVGHALPFSNDWLRHGVGHFSNPKVAGYGRRTSQTVRSSSFFQFRQMHQVLNRCIRPSTSYFIIVWSRMRSF